MDLVTIIGAGLAGCEAALQLASRGIPVRLHEMKPARRTPAQVSDQYAELVCSNSFRSSSLSNAVGVIKEEMRMLGGRLIRFADEARVPAGDALAVDREKFAGLVTAAVRSEPNIEVVEGVVTSIPDSGDVIVATGPLTAAELAADIVARCGDRERLYFYDSIAPIVAADSIDEDRVFRASRYGKGGSDDYVNCPLDEAGYAELIRSITEADKVVPKDFEGEAAKFFEGCLPIEEIVSRGPEALRFGCMKPVGLEDPRTGKRAHAVVQLRAEDVDQTAFNIVGFQTRMKWGEQKRIFRMIPGLENAEFLRFGQVHRNTYIDSPSLLDEALRLKSAPHIRFAGQITGVEGYVESTASGLMAGLILAAERLGKHLPLPPETTAMGALHAHVLGKRKADASKKAGHVPSNIHWGLFPALGVRAKKREKRELYGKRALEDATTYISKLDF